MFTSWTTSDKPGFGWPPCRALHRFARVMAVVLLCTLTPGMDVEGGAQSTVEGSEVDSQPHDIVQTTLLDVTFRAETLRSGGETAVLYAEIRMPPGYHLDARYHCNPDEVFVFLPLDGPLTIEVSGESYVRGPQDSEWQIIQAGTAWVIEAGEVWLFHSRFDDDLKGIGNRNEHPIRVVWAPVWVNSFACGAVHPGELMMTWYETYEPEFPGADPIRFKLDRLSVPPNTILSSDGSGLLDLTGAVLAMEPVWISVETGAIDIRYVPRLPEDTIAKEVVRIEAGDSFAGDYFPPSTPDLRIEFVSGEEPTDILIFRIVGGEGTQEGPWAPF